MGLSITQGKGFQLTFKNGYTVSVQFGKFNYCEHHLKLLNGTIGATPVFEREYKEFYNSKDAEIAAFYEDKDGNRHWYAKDDWGDDVCGYVEADEVADFIYEVKNLPSVVQT